MSGHICSHLSPGVTNVVFRVYPWLLICEFFLVCLHIVGSNRNIWSEVDVLRSATGNGKNERCGVTVAPCFFSTTFMVWKLWLPCFLFSRCGGVVSSFVDTRFSLVLVEHRCLRQRCSGVLFPLRSRLSSVCGTDGLLGVACVCCHAVLPSVGWLDLVAVTVLSV